MRIASYALDMQSRHEETRRLDVRENLEVWTGPRPGGRRQPAPDAGVVQLSGESRQKLKRDGAEAVGSDLEKNSAAADPRIRLLRAIVEFFTGRKVKDLDLDDFFAKGGAPDVQSPANAGEPPAQQASGFGAQYDFEAHYEETESVSFAAQGLVQTADGKQIAFSLDLSLSRSYSEHVQTSMRIGDAKLTDPLVIDFPGSAATLASTRFRFDLDADGKQEDVPMLTGGVGFLAFDRDRNGTIDNGSELFGPATGNGFAELAALDSDGNGWIDEADNAYAQLGVWRPESGDGKDKGSLTSLGEAGIGALHTGAVATSFAIKDANNATLGAMRASSVYLTEDGRAGSVRQIDLSV